MPKEKRWNGKFFQAATHPMSVCQKIQSTSPSFLQSKFPSHHQGELRAAQTRYATGAGGVDDRGETAQTKQSFVGINA